MNVLTLDRPHVGIFSTLVLLAALVMGYDLYLQATTLSLDLTIAAPATISAPDCCGDPVFTCPPICGGRG